MGHQPAGLLQTIHSCSEFVIKTIFIFRPSKIEVGSSSPKGTTLERKPPLPWLNRDGIWDGGNNDKAFFMADGLSCFDHLSLAFCESAISRLRHPICPLLSALPRLRLLVISCG